MEYKDNTPKQEENTHTPGTHDAPVEPTAATTASTSRRTITAILVLIAALLLGYTLYDVLLRQPAPTPMEQPESSTEASAEDETPSTKEVSEYTDAEKIAILEAMGETEGEISITEENERRAILEAMDSDSDSDSDFDDGLSEAEKIAILEAMQ
jgi:uncharacterized protein HemX